MSTITLSMPDESLLALKVTPDQMATELRLAATVLNSPQAVLMSVLVVRAFVKMREVLVNHRELARQLAELERRLTGHDDAIRHLFTVIRQLLAPPAQPAPPRKQIGFHIRERSATYRVKRKGAT